MATFEIADMSIEPGELKFGQFPVGQMRDGSLVHVPLMVMNGAEDGPALWVDAACHGDEIAGIEVIRRLMREEVDPEELHGAIVGAPVLNPVAFQIGTREVSLSAGEANLNRIFPGRPDGTLFERMAHRVFTEGMLTCDYVISFHSNVYPAVDFSPVTVCDDREILEASIELAEAFGFPLCEIKGGEGWSVWAAQNEGRPAFIVELLAQGYLDEPSIQNGVRGMLNVLRHLNMIEGDVQPLPDQRVPPGRYGRGTITSDTGGLTHFKKEAGDWLDVGTVVAVVRDVYGEIIEEVQSPIQGYIRTILFGPHDEAVHEGAIIATVLQHDPDRRYFS